MFRKVLIANRGAIAVRIEKTLKRMNIKSVAVYSKADQDSLHADRADEAINIGDGPVKENYLNADLLIKIAKETKAEAIHPGYGFLSENSDFARKCAENGIVFIGPTPEQMEIFGLKHSAREIALKAGVPMLEGTGLLKDVEEAAAVGKELGYPVILKSTAGGGGIGMRVCDDEKALRAAYDSCRYLAENNFKNDGLFLEKYLKKARHIEVQIFGNEYGEVVALAERDCSVQRRNQKVIEECPAPGISEETRKLMMEAARNLALEVGYRSAGTVEFLYDTESSKFYFLEVNTRLQVEHGVTEEVLGIDLVEWMIKEAAGKLKNLASLFGKPSGHSIQARIYAEDALRNFAPSGGKIDKVFFSELSRVETWIQDNTVVSPFYDPLLAKIIVGADNRKDAIEKLNSVINETGIYGVTTGLDYIKEVINTETYSSGDLYTHMLDQFTYREQKLEVLEGGIQTTVQDYPARLGYWDIGVPPSGPMDNFAFRIGNRILGNKADASGIEFTLKGGKYKFRDFAVICLAGANMNPRLDGNPISMYEPVKVEAGQILELGEAVNGMRSYLLLKGGFNVPKIMGSAATFTLGGFGGHSGRTLRTGDLIHINKAGNDKCHSFDKETLPQYGEVWEIGVIPGPHCTGEFLKLEYLEQLTTAEWKVHFNSDRTGVRLLGPTPLWKREDGGEAGLHPSNIHDTAYAVGTIDLTGDMPIILGPDGPSLGGFVCPCTIPSAELWKAGQLRPGNTVRFRLISLETAERLRDSQEVFLEGITAGKRSSLPVLKHESGLDNTYPVLVNLRDNRQDALVIRCAGDEYMLVEYGEMEIELRLRIRVHALMELIKADSGIPLTDVTPGIRSLQIHIDSRKMSVRKLADKVVELDSRIKNLDSFKVKSRIIRMPLSWNDASAQLAVERYYQNVRPNAPWCPSNIEFIRRINGLESTEKVREILYSATYIVMGLGDVYLGAPVCIPLDPRQRLVTTKYNPARTWTPENAVGIGGAYMGIYGMEGPGGYQLVGRTIQTWNPVRSTKNFEKGKPWLLNFFDQIRFYPVTSEELLKIREDFLRGRYEVQVEETEFDYGEYLKYLKSIETEARVFKKQQISAFNAEKIMWKENGLDEFVSSHGETEAKVIDIPEGATAVNSNMPASVWKILVKPGDKVEKGDVLIVEESMKMEFEQVTPCDGVVLNIYVKETEEVVGGQLLVTIG